MLQEEFWIKSRWLLHGSLLVLCDTPERFHFVEVVQRSVKTLNPVSAQPARPALRASIGIHFCDPARMRKALSALIKHQSAAGARAGAAGPAGQGAWLVQVAHDFGIIKPILKTLQSAELLDLPFKAQIFEQSHGSPIAAPEWQIDEAAAAWIEPRLRRMDDAQREAFEHATTAPVALIQGPPGSLVLPVQLHLASVALIH